jgi:ubiquinone/menaquinone biosynthesis C-methylase UbiE
MKTSHKDDFKFLSGFYDRIIHKRNDIFWIDSFDGTMSDTVIEIGGGTGRILENFQNRAPHLYLCDYSFSMLKKAKQKNLFSEVCSQAELLPFSSESFRFIVMVDTLHHLINPSVAINEIIRILDKRGLFIIEEPDIRKWNIKIIAFFEKLIGMRSHFYRETEIVEMIKCKHVSLTSLYDNDSFCIQVRKN